MNLQSNQGNNSLVFIVNQLNYWDKAEDFEYKSASDFLIGVDFCRLPSEFRL